MWPAGWPTTGSAAGTGSRYCLIVNHLAEIAAAIADCCPARQERLEAALWDRARAVLAGFARDHGWTPELRALLAGAPAAGQGQPHGALGPRGRPGRRRTVPVPNPLANEAPG